MARFLIDARPDLISPAVVHGLARRADAVPEAERLDVLITLVDWELAIGVERLANVLEIDPRETLVAILRGRKSLGRDLGSSPVDAGSILTSGRDFT